MSYASLLITELEAQIVDNEGLLLRGIEAEVEGQDIPAPWIYYDSRRIDALMRDMSEDVTEVAEYGYRDARGNLHEGRRDGVTTEEPAQDNKSSL